MTSRSYGASVGPFELFILFPNVIMIAFLGKNMQLSVQTLFFNLFPMIVKRPSLWLAKQKTLLKRICRNVFVYTPLKSMCTLPSPSILYSVYFISLTSCTSFSFNLLSFLTSPCIPSTILERKRGKKCCGQMVWSVKKTKQVCCCCGLSNWSVFPFL